MGVQTEIDRINNNVQSTLNTIADTGVAVGTGSDALPAAAAALANEKADKTLPRTVTLTAAGWDAEALTQAVSVNGATATNVKVVAPNEANVDEYATYGVKATGEGAGTVTFTCTTIPEVDLSVNIAILG